MDGILKIIARFWITAGLVLALFALTTLKLRMNIATARRKDVGCRDEAIGYRLRGVAGA